MKNLISRIRSLGHVLRDAVLLTCLAILRVLVKASSLASTHAVLWVGRIASCAVFAYAWYKVTTRYDISQLDGTPEYRFGVLVALTVIWALCQFLLILGRITKKPLPLDRDFPPTKMIYLQGEDEPELCHCHNRPIADGAEILHWPQPAKLVCVKKSKTA